MYQPKKQMGLLISQDQLDAAVTAAAKEGAREALKQIGLGDENAINDVREFRDLISAWRFAKKTAFETFVKWVTVAFIGLIIAGVTFHYSGTR